MRRLLVAALLVAACGAATPEPTPLAIAVPTQEPGPTACMEALFQGVLVADARLGIAMQDPDGGVVEVVWPFGYSAVATPEAVLLLDEEGEVVGRVGDTIQVGGGNVGGEGAGRWIACAPVVVVAPG